jgi:hypothetical protein
LHLITLNHTHTHTHTQSSGRGISPKQRYLPDSTQHSPETDIRAPGGIRARNPSTRVAADPSLRPLGYWDRHLGTGLCTNEANKVSVLNNVARFYHNRRSELIQFAIQRLYTQLTLYKLLILFNWTLIRAIPYT